MVLDFGVVDVCVFDRDANLGRYCSPGTDGGRAKSCWNYGCTGNDRKLCRGRTASLCSSFSLALDPRILFAFGVERPVARRRCFRTIVIIYFNINYTVNRSRKWIDLLLTYSKKLIDLYFDLDIDLDFLIFDFTKIWTLH